MRAVIREAWFTYRKNRSADWFCVLSGAMLLYLLSLLVLATLGALGFQQKVRADVSLDLVLSDGASVLERAGLEQMLESLAGVESYRFISRELAKEELLERFSGYDEFDELARAVEGSPNALPESYRVTPLPHWKSYEMMDVLARKAGRLRGVSGAYYGGEWLSRTERITDFVLLADGLLLAFVLFAVSFIVFQTVRTTVLARRAVIEVMHFSGAPIWKISAPFMLNGLTSSLLAGALSGLALLGTVWLLSLYFPVSLWVGLVPAGASALCGLVLGWTASRSAVKEVV